MEVVDGADWIAVGYNLFSDGYGWEFEVPWNTSDETRTCTLLVTATWADGSTKTATITVTQAGGVHILTASDIELSADYTEFDLRDYVDTNADGIYVDTYDGMWLGSFNGIGIAGDFDDEIWAIWSANANKTGETRTGTIVIVAQWNDGTERTITVHVTQLA